MTDHCSSVVNHTNVTLEENKRRANFLNPERLPYRKSQVDGCLITDGIKADALVSKISVCSVIVEFKGEDVDHAVDQLERTIGHENIRGLLEKKIGCLVVCSKYPRFDTYVAKAKQKFARKYGAGFHVVCNSGEFVIEEVAKINGKIGSTKKK